MCNKAKVDAYAHVSPFSGDLLGDSHMSNVLDKSFIHRSYPKLAYGSIYPLTQPQVANQQEQQQQKRFKTVYY